MENNLAINFQLTERSERRYVATRTQVEQKDIPNTLPPLCDKVISQLLAQNIKPSGPPFFRYLKMEGTVLDVEVGAIIAETFTETADLKNGSFLKGTYAVALYTGPYHKLYNVHMALEEWGKENNVNFNGSRTEFYLTDEAQEPNPENWQTSVEFETGEGEGPFQHC